MTRRLLRYIGKEPSAVDPYWDFEHLPGEPFDADALRAWRMKVFVNKPARVRLSLSLVTRKAGDPEGAAPRPLRAEEHVLRCDAGPDRDSASYHRLERPVMEIEPPTATFAADLTRLDPGEILLQADVLGAEQADREMRFRVQRDPYYTYPGLAPGKAPSVRSHTGLREVIIAGKRRMSAGYRWQVERHEWDPVLGKYQSRGTQLVEARAEVSGGRTLQAVGWRLGTDASPGNTADPGEERALSEYSSASGVGLPLPNLVGATVAA